VQVVDGGLPALLAAGFVLTAELPTPQPTSPYPVVELTRPRADIEEVDRARRDPARAVIDVRAAFRYRGDKEPIDPIAGHIPGAKNIELTQNLKDDGSFKDASELRALYTAALSGVPIENTIIHCGSGVTACHTLLALERAGLPGAKLYVGSWSEWCRNVDRPREPR
jgi:thiosulfate/3-mercaptopyruvate sulfurtransferase